MAVVVFAAGRWTCDGTIRDQQFIDQLVRDATWWFPEAPRPALRRVHAVQTHAVIRAVRHGVGEGGAAIARRWR